MSDEEIDLGDVCPACHEPWLRTDEPARPLPLRELPAPLRARVRLPELRRALDDRAHVEHRAVHLQPLPELDAPADLMAGRAPRRRALDPRGRLRPPRRAGRRGAGRRRAHDPRRHHGRPLRAGAEHGPGGRRARWPTRSTTPGGYVDVHLMVERPERHVAAFAEAGADGITIHVEATPHANYALAAVRDAGCRAGLALHARARRRRAIAELVDDARPAAVHDREPRLGRPGVPAGLDREARAPAGAASASARRSRSTAASTSRRRARAPARARPCSSPARPCSARRTRRLPTGRSRPAHASECGQPYGRGSCLRPQSFTSAWPSPSSSSTTTRRSGPARASCSSPRGSASWARRRTARRRITECCRLRPQVVLLDVQLPDIDGFDVCQQITAYAEHPTVIMTSSRDGSDFGPLVTTSGRAGSSPRPSSRESACRSCSDRDRTAARARARRDRGHRRGARRPRDRALVRPRRRHAGVTAALGLFLGWSWIGVGLFAWWRRPDNRFGVLMTAVGFAFFLGVLTAADSSWLFTIGVLFSSLYVAVFVHMLLAYPDGRIDSPRLRKVLAGRLRALGASARCPRCCSPTPSGSAATAARRLGDLRRPTDPARPRILDAADLGGRGGPRRLRPLRADQALAGRDARCSGARWRPVLWSGICLLVVLAGR